MTHTCADDQVASAITWRDVLRDEIAKARTAAITT